MKTWTELMREVAKVTLRDGLPMSHRFGRCQVCDSTRLRVLKKIYRPRARQTKGN